MIHIIIGILAIAWAIWSMFPDWMFIGEVLKILFYVALILFGIVAVLAGLRRVKASN